MTHTIATTSAKLPLWRSLPQALFNMVYPPKCRLCGRLTAGKAPTLSALDFDGRPNSESALFDLPATNMCADCLATFKVLPPDVCTKCSCVMENGTCLNCQIHPQIYTDHAMALFFYDHNIGPVIKRFKYGGDPYVGRFLSLSLLAGLAICKQNNVTYDMILPVPLHPKKQKQRKFNQTIRLMEHWPNLQTLLPCLAKTKIDFALLRRTKHTRSQAGLNAADRQQNMTDAFEVIDNRDLTGLNILVTDDIITTGATTENCAKALKAQGAKRVDVLGIARTMPHLNPEHLLEI